MKGITEKEREKRGTEGDGGREGGKEGERERNYGKSVSNTSYHLFIILCFLLVFISHSCNMSTKASIRFRYLSIWFVPFTQFT